MRSVPFRKVLWDLAKRCGMFPEEEGLDRAVAAQLAEAISSCMKLAWEYYWWPEAMQTRKVEVQRSPDGQKFVPRLLPDGEELTAVASVSREDPRRFDVPARELTFELGSDGDADVVFLPECAPDEVWVRWRGPAPQFTAEEWREGQTYFQGDVVYFPPMRECVQCRVPQTDQTPENNAALWGVVRFPKWLEEAVKAGAQAYHERTEGQHGAAGQIEEIMTEWLDHEVNQYHLQMYHMRSNRPAPAARR